MTLYFMTKKNSVGVRKYLAIDFEKKKLSRLGSAQLVSMVFLGVEIKTKDYYHILNQCEKSGFEEVDYLG